MASMPFQATLYAPCLADWPPSLVPHQAGCLAVHHSFLCCFTKKRNGTYSRWISSRTSVSSHAIQIDRNRCAFPVRASGIPPTNGVKPRLRYHGVNVSAALGLMATEGVSTDKACFMSDQQPPPPTITKSDEDFAEEGLEFVWGLNGIVLDELNDLFQRVGFPRRDLSRLGIALENTYAMIWVRAARKSRLAKEGQLLGFARATSDGALSATIWDVAVTPAWQRNGLGRALVERLTAKLVVEGISTVALYAEPNVVGMYEKLGFVRDPKGVKGLAFQSRSSRGKALIGR